MVDVAVSATVLGGVAVLLSAGATALTIQKTSRDNSDARQKLTEVQEAESELIKPATVEGLLPNQAPDENGIELQTIWALTQKRIDAYHGIATSQSRTSFVSSQAATGLGFVLVIITGLIAASAKTTVGSISAGTVGVIGGGLSAYVASTFMKAQQEASTQLSRFFSQPTEISRALLAERLLVEIKSDVVRNKSVAYIIRSMMTTTREANASGRVGGIAAKSNGTRVAVEPAKTTGHGPDDPKAESEKAKQQP